MTTLIEAFSRLVEADPDKPFLVLAQGDAEQRVTFGELLCRAVAIRDRLSAMGVAEGDGVPILLRHGPEPYAAFLGAMLLGAVPAFLPLRGLTQAPEAYGKAHRLLFQRLGARAVITFRDNLEPASACLPGDSLGVLTVEDGAGDLLPSLSQALDRAKECARTRPGQAAFLQFSSGATGLEKGVMLSHEVVLRHIDTYRRVLGLTSSHRVATWLPLHHDMGLIACFLLPLLTGATVVALEALEWVARPAMLLEAVQRHGCHFVWMPDFAFHHLARSVPEEETWNLVSVRAFISCSEPCRPESFDAFLARFGTMGVSEKSLLVCYAMTEAVFAITQTLMGTPVRTVYADPEVLSAEGRFVPREGGLGLLSCGRPLPGVTLAIRDGYGHPVPEGQVGELEVSSPTLFDGYFRHPEITASRLKDGVLYTGDLGFLQGGELFITGRKKAPANGEGSLRRLAGACANP